MNKSTQEIHQTWPNEDNTLMLRSQGKERCDVTSTLRQRKGRALPAVMSCDNCHVITWYCHMTEVGGLSKAQRGVSSAVGPSLAGGSSQWGVMWRGGGVLQDDNKKDDTDVTPQGRPDFVALGRKMQGSRRRRKKTFLSTLAFRQRKHVSTNSADLFVLRPDPDCHGARWQTRYLTFGLVWKDFQTTLFRPDCLWRPE